MFYKIICGHINAYSLYQGIVYHHNNRESRRNFFLYPPCSKSNVELHSIINRMTLNHDLFFTNMNITDFGLEQFTLIIKSCFEF